MKWRWIAAGGAGAAAGWTFARAARQRSPRFSNLDLPGGTTDLSPEASIYFVGTATTLIRCAGFTILTDPNFLHRGEEVHLGYGLRSTRLTEPAMSLEDLPPVDFVVLSHMHEDHFDRRVAAGLERSIPILTTPGAAGDLRKRGFARTCSLRTWDSVEVRRGQHSVRVTAMPGRHGPLAVASLMPSVMGSMLEFRMAARPVPYRLYISGDTLVYSDLKEIPRRYAGVDLALLHLGGTRVLGILVTMDGRQGVRAIQLIQPRLTIPIHYNDYDVFESPLEEFARAVREAGLEDRVRYLRHGETYTFVPAPFAEVT